MSTAQPLRLEVIRAETSTDREAAYQFRYQVYVQEMGRYHSTADHDRKMLIDPEDDHSVIYLARQGTQVVFTRRTTFGEDGFSARQVAQYRLEPFLAQIPARLMCVSERMMAAPRLRGAPIMETLREGLGQLMGERQVKIMFGACEPHLLARNLALGCHTYAQRNINSDDAGYLIPLITFLDGPDGLAQAIAGPGTEPVLPHLIQQVLAGTLGGASTAATDAESYWMLLRHHLDHLGETAVHAFSGFGEQELQRCLERSAIITCVAGDRLVKKGGSSDNLFVVLAGSLQVRDAGTVINSLTAGDIVGETAFLLGVPRQRDVIAVTDDVRVLALSDNAIRKLLTDQPALAAKLLLNLSKMLCHRLTSTSDQLKADQAPRAWRGA
jgi:hypothetical protein